MSSIPSTYSSLQLRVRYKDTGTATYSAPSVYIAVRFNSDTGANYNNHYLYGNGTSALASNSSSSNVNIVGCYMNSDTPQANMFATAIIDLHDYASTSKNKTVRYFAGGNNNTATTTYATALGSGLWRSTSAINSIQFTPGDTAFAAGTTISLYGVK